VPAVIAGGGSVFATAAAVEWLTLLEAMEQPHRDDRVGAAALSCFFGHSPDELDRDRDVLVDDVADTLRAWAEVFALRGVAAVLEASTAGGLPARVLSRVGGERDLTDLRHIGEALHEVAQHDRLGLVAVLTWLRDQVADAAEGRGTERTRRLDSDAAAVQLVTIHASKGLEYPVVYLPSLWDRNVPKPHNPLFHDDAGQRCLDVGSGGPDWQDHVRRWREEEAGEWLRLLYVAVTRARSQVVAWWAPTRNTDASPLHRMLQGRRPDSSEVPQTFPPRTDDEAAEIFARWHEAGGPVPEPAKHAPLGDDPPPADRPELSVRAFTREVDVAWRRTSYSSLTADTAPHAGPGVDSEPEVRPKDDEEVDATAVDEPALFPDPTVAVPSPMRDLPVGATFGSLVHAVLEHADPDADDLRAELLQHVDEQRVWWPVELDREVLADALVAVCDTPLGPLAGDATLRSLSLSDRLRELDFELPLAGGDLVAQAPLVRLGDLAPLLREHLPPGDPVRSFADALDAPQLGGQLLRGYLTGSVDVVLRLPGPRYLVVDYKTNWLGPAPGAEDEVLTADHYRPSALAAAMGHSDYPLQALLYAVVLHRYLRWRQPGYDPATHLGGVLYLYLRGMCGPATPVVDGEPCGVWSWRPPVALVEALSDLLDGRVRT
jgi:exodeoxyribonuclease V beta subunit